ncbi:MAG: translocation/assembly module TamB domain-containing protein [Acidobacteriota bacterium]
MRRYLRSRPAKVAAAAAVGLALLLLAAHTPPVRSRVLALVAGTLASDFNIALTARDLSYNLLRPRVTLRDLRVAAVGHEDRPFFAAELVDVRLAWGVYRGDIAFEQITLGRGRVDLFTDARGVSNLPASTGPETDDREPLVLDIRALDVRGLDVAFADEAAALAVSMPGLTADLDFRSIRVFEGASGELAAPGGVEVRIGEQRLAVAPFTTALAFDGRNLSLQDLALAAPEATLVVKGRVNGVLGAPVVDLAFSGTADLRRLAVWVEPPVPLAGALGFAGRVTGPLDAYALEADLDGRALDVGRETLALAAVLRATPAKVTSERLRVTLASGGVIDGTFEVSRDEAAASRAELRWTDLAAAALFRAADEDTLPLGARFTGRLAAELPPRAGAFTATLTNAATATGGADAVPLEGSLAFRLTARDWRLTHAHRLGAVALNGEAGGARHPETLTDSSLAGTATLAVDDLGALARDLGRLAVDVPEDVAAASGRLAATLTLAGRLSEPRVAGRVDGDAVSLAGFDAVTLGAALTASPRRVELADVNVTRGRARITGSAAANLETGALSGTVTLSAADVADLQPMLPAAQRLTGPLDARVTLGGTVDTPRASVDLDGRNLVLADQPVQSLAAVLGLNGSRLVVERLEADIGGGRLSARASYDIASEIYDAALAADGVTWRGSVEGLGEVAVGVNARFEGAGTLTRPGGQGDLALLPRGGALAPLLADGRVTIRLDGDAARVTSHLPALRTLVSATVGTAAPFAYDATAVVDRLDLAPLLELAGVVSAAVSGTTSFSARARGTLANALEVAGVVNLQALDAVVGGVAVALPAPSRVTFDTEEVRVEDLALGVGRGTLRTAGRLRVDGQGDWTGSFDGRLDEIVQMAAAFGVPPELIAEGRLQASWRSTGTIDDTTGQLDLTGARLRWADLPPLSDLALRVTAGAATVDLTSFSGTWEGGSITGRGSVPRARLVGPTPDIENGVPAGAAEFRIADVTARSLAHWLTPEQLARVQGRLAAVIDARLLSPSLDGITATLTLDQAAFTLSGVPAEQARPSRARLDAGTLSFDDVTWNVGGAPLAVAGTVRLADEDPALDVTVRGTVDLRVLSAFVPDLSADGAAELYVRVGGTAATPVPEGRLQLRGGELVWAEPPLVVSGLAGPLVFDRTRMRAEGITAEMNGGSVVLDGGFRLDGTTIASGALTAQLQRVALELADGLQAEVDGLLSLSPTRAGWRLGGDVRVTRSSFTENISVAALAAAGSRPAPAGRRTFADAVQLDLDVRTVQDMLVDNNYGRLEGGAALRIVGTLADPGLTGRVTLREGGEVYLAGRTFRVTRGNVSFVDPARIEPDLDIAVRTVADGEDITLTLSGTPDQLTTEIRSETNPGRTSGELYGALLGTNAGITGADAATLLSAEILGVTGRAIGLDTLRVERGFSEVDFRSDPSLLATETDPSTRLTLSKRLRSDVEVTLSQNLNQSGLAAIVSYRPLRNVELRGVTLDDSDRSVAIRHEITFGGGSARREVAEAPRTVRDVQIAGDAGRPLDQVRASLGLKVGDRFNFHRWQRDIQRLRDWYRDQGRLEARVRASREEVGADGVVLTYHLTEGPSTEIRVHGVELSSEARRDIEERWSRSIFDRFLVEAVRRRVEEDLVSRNVFMSVVDVSVTAPAEDEKVLAIEVAPGRRVSERRIAFSGHAAFDEKRLKAIVAGAGLPVDGWMDRGALGDAIRFAYVDAGYLDAVVRVDEPRVEGRTAVLPVGIVEGPRHTIASVAVEGVDAARTARVSGAVAMAAGDPYIADEVVAARRAIERQYREWGFNEVRVDSRTEPVPDAASLALTFVVEEGPQQVLTEVVVSGAEETRPGIIEGTLGLEAGAPADLGGWARARKRLYDTNLFREVDIDSERVGDVDAAGVQPVRARVTVVEWPTWRLRYGLELNDVQLDAAEDGTTPRNQSLGLTADLLNQNLFGRAVAGGLAGRYERSRWTVRNFFSTPRFFGLPATSTVFLRLSHEEVPVSETFGFVSDVRSVTVEQRWRPLASSEFALSYRFERNHTFDPNPSPFDPFPLDFTADVGRINASALIDRRDDPFAATDGWFASATLSQAARSFGADFSNARLFVQLYHFQPVGPVVLASRVQFGSQFGDEALLPTERFFAGGGTTVRGYAENALGPRDFLDRASGGEAIVLLNHEARFPVFRWVRGVAFLDAGAVFDRREDVSLGDLEGGAGLGLRLDTPYALFRVDMGVPLATRRALLGSSGTRLGSIRWYFGIGHIF